MSLLKVNNLSVCYSVGKHRKIKAVDKVNLEVGVGESWALIGESGCGKSTFAHSILRLLPSNAKITEGCIIFKGNVDLTKVEEDFLRNIRFRNISIIFQASMNMLDPLMKIEDQIAELLVLHGKVESHKDAVREAQNLLELVGIPSHKGRNYPHQLSGGQKQRVSIAMAIALEPDLIIADEPFTALDVMLQAQLIELLKEIREKINNSLLFITHDIHIVREICENIAIMYAGKIVEYGGLDKLIDSAMHPYTVALFDSAPDITGTIKPKSIPGYPPDLSNPPSGCRFHPRCPYRFERCKKEEPILLKLGENHYGACFLVEKK